MPPAGDIEALRTIADYQFGQSAGQALFPSGDAITIARTRSGRPRQVKTSGGRLVTYNTDGRFTLGLAGGRRLQQAFPAPTGRVVVGEESVPYVRGGRNAFAKFVTDVDGAIRPGDEVIVVGPDDGLLGVGRAELGAAAMRDFTRGMAVMVREGAD